MKFLKRISNFFWQYLLFYDCKLKQLLGIKEKPDYIKHPGSQPGCSPSCLVSKKEMLDVHRSSIRRVLNHTMPFEEFTYAEKQCWLTDQMVEKIINHQKQEVRRLDRYVPLKEALTDIFVKQGCFTKNPIDPDYATRQHGKKPNEDNNNIPVKKKDDNNAHASVNSPSKKNNHKKYNNNNKKHKFPSSVDNTKSKSKTKSKQRT